MTFRASMLCLSLSAFLVAACGGGGGKAESTAPAAPTTTEPAEPAQPVAPAPGDDEAADATPTAAPTDDQPAASDADEPSGEKILAFVSALADLVHANASDCDAMGTAMMAHIDTDPGLLKFMNSMTGTPKHKAWMQKNKDAFAAISQKMMGIGNCMGNDKVKAALGRFN